MVEQRTTTATTAVVDLLRLPWLIWNVQILMIDLIAWQKSKLDWTFLLIVTIDNQWKERLLLLARRLVVRNRRQGPICFLGSSVMAGERENIFFCYFLEVVLNMSARRSIRAFTIATFTPFMDPSFYLFICAESTFDHTPFPGFFLTPLFDHMLQNYPCSPCTPTGLGSIMLTVTS